MQAYNIIGCRCDECRRRNTEESNKYYALNKDHRKKQILQHINQDRHTHNEKRRAKKEDNRNRSDEQILIDQKRLRPYNKKRCHKCKETKLLHEFSKNRSEPDGIHTACSLCANKIRTMRYYKGYLDFWIENKIDPNRCYLCESLFEHVDHVYPLRHGGPHKPWNFRPACSWRNLQKHDTLPKEYFLFLIRDPTSSPTVVSKARKALEDYRANILPLLFV